MFRSLYTDPVLVFDPYQSYYQQRKYDDLRQQQMLHQRELEAQRQFEYEQALRERLQQEQPKRTRQQRQSNARRFYMDDDAEYDQFVELNQPKPSRSVRISISDPATVKEESMKLKPDFKESRSSSESTLTDANTQSGSESYVQTSETVANESKTVEYGPEHSEAATKIQNTYKSYNLRKRAKETLAKLSEIADEFEKLIFLLKNRALQFPPQLEFVENTTKLVLGHKKNRSFVEFEEGLLSLLLKLDGFQSNGIVEVRDQRKRLISRIQKELENLDSYKLDVYNRKNESTSTVHEMEVEEQESAPSIVTEMEVDKEKEQSEELTPPNVAEMEVEEKDQSEESASEESVDVKGME
ncbi:hypothetical protein HK098_001178 [Nowakowskiella sp. JEL0407]|nr:hypothetical protein HK098_001178 [Nowakowskiella sp. JEL0407]